MRVVNLGDVRSARAHQVMPVRARRRPHRKGRIICYSGRHAPGGLSRAAPTHFRFSIPNLLPGTQTQYAAPEGGNTTPQPAPGVGVYLHIIMSAHGAVQASGSLWTRSEPPCAIRKLQLARGNPKLAGASGSVLCTRTARPDCLIPEWVR